MDALDTFHDHIRKVTPREQLFEFDLIDTPDGCSLHPRLESYLGRRVSPDYRGRKFGARISEDGRTCTDPQAEAEGGHDGGGRREAAGYGPGATKLTRISGPHLLVVTVLLVALLGLSFSQRGVML